MGVETDDKVKEYRGYIRNWEELCERLDIPLDLTREEREELDPCEGI